MRQVRLRTAIFVYFTSLYFNRCHMLSYRRWARATLSAILNLVSFCTNNANCWRVSQGAHSPAATALLGCTRPIAADVARHVVYVAMFICGKKGSPCSTAERRVLELIPVLGSQPAGDVNHKPDGRLPLLSARPAVTPATRKRAATNFSSWWTEARWV